MITLPGLSSKNSAIAKLAGLQGLVLGGIGGTLRTTYNPEPACTLYYKDGKDSMGYDIGQTPVRTTAASGIIGVAAGILESINPFNGVFKKRDNEETPQALRNAIIMGISRNPSAEVMRHPIEDGTNFVDHRVINPEELVIRMIFPAEFYRDLYAELENASYMDRLFTVYTRSGVLNNMILVSYPHEEDPEQYDVLAVEITLREVKFVTPSQGTMTAQNQRDVIDANTTQQGQVGTSTVILNPDAREEVKNKGLQGWGGI